MGEGAGRKEGWGQGGWERCKKVGLPSVAFRLQQTVPQGSPDNSPSKNACSNSELPRQQMMSDATTYHLGIHCVYLLLELSCKLSVAH